MYSLGLFQSWQLTNIQNISLLLREVLKCFSDFSSKMLLIFLFSEILIQGTCSAFMAAFLGYALSICSLWVCLHLLMCIDVASMCMEFTFITLNPSSAMCTHGIWKSKWWEVFVIIGWLSVCGVRLFFKVVTLVNPCLSFGYYLTAHIFCCCQVGKHIVVVLPMRALCAKYQWHGTTEDVVNVQKVSCLFWQ